MHMKVPQSCLFAALFMVSTGSLGALPPPLPLTDEFAIHHSSPLQFDNVAGTFWFSSPITALQSPGLAITADDALIAAGAMLTMYGTVSGGEFNAEPLDTGAVLSITSEVSIDGKVVMREVAPAMSYFQSFHYQGSTVRDWAGPVSERFFDQSVVASAWLKDYSESDLAKITAVQAPNDVPGTWVLVPDAIVVPPTPPIPEPESWALMVVGLAVLVARKRST